MIWCPNCGKEIGETLATSKVHGKRNAEGVFIYSCSPKAERSGVAQPCRRSVNSCAEAGAEARDNSLNSSVVAPKEAVRALVVGWASLAATHDRIAKEEAIDGDSAGCRESQACAKTLRRCAKELWDLQLGAGQRSDQRAIRRNDKVRHGGETKQ